MSERASTVLPSPVRATCRPESRRCDLRRSPSESRSSAVAIPDVELRLRETEVEDFDATFVGQHDIGRFEISMRDPLLVRGGDRIGEWNRDVEERAERKARLRQPLGECASSHELHRDEVQAVGFFNGMHRHDVGVIERRDGFGFPCESAATRCVNGQLRRQDLERDLAIESCVFRQIDLAHPTGANRLDDPVVSDGSGRSPGRARGFAPRRRARRAGSPGTRQRGSHVRAVTPPRAAGRRRRGRRPREMPPLLSRSREGGGDDRLEPLPSGGVVSHGTVAHSIREGALIEVADQGVVTGASLRRFMPYLA